MRGYESDATFASIRARKGGVETDYSSMAGSTKGMYVVSRVIDPIVGESNFTRGHYFAYRLGKIRDFQRTCGAGVLLSRASSPLVRDFYHAFLPYNLSANTPVFSLYNCFYIILSVQE